MVREKSGKSQGILLYSNCRHPVNAMILKELPSFFLFSANNFGFKGE